MRSKHLPRLLLVLELILAPAQLSAAAQASAPAIPAELNLETVLSLALENHPALAGAKAAVAGAESLLQQSRVLPNPLLTVQTENWRFYGDPSFDVGRDLDLFIYGSQTLERGGKRERRADLADQGRRIAELRVDEIQWRIGQEVRRAFWRALLAQREEELLRENAGLFEQVTRYHEERVREGAMAEVDLIRVQLEQDRLRLQAEAAAAETARARKDLLRAMGLADAAMDFRLAGQPSELPANGVGGAELTRQATARRPDILLAEADLESARRHVDLEIAQSRPDWDVLFGYKRTDGFNTLIGGLVVPLPLFDKNEGNVGFRRTEVDRLESMLRERRIAVSVEVRGAIEILARRVEMLRRVEEGMVQRAEESWEIAQAAYREGASDLLRFLDAQRSLNEIRLLRNRMKMEVQLGIADLEEAVGSNGLPIGLETFRAEN